jgi:ABC-type glutathione transport system ATPase component
LGGPAGLQVLDVAEPHPGPGEVRIRVHGATVNPTDTIFIAGPADGPGPYVPGADAAGMSDVADRPPHHLSFGQRRRVAVATVLAMRPDVLVLDEPSSNLDPASRRELAQIVRSLGLTTLMVTHDLP